jgi:hypothetical protein
VGFSVAVPPRGRGGAEADASIHERQMGGSNTLA